MSIIPPSDHFRMDEEAPGTEAHGDARLRKRTRTALMLVALLVVGFFGLAAVLHVGGAVIGSGEVTVDSQVKTISHPTGGILTELLVREGDHVAAGQPLLRFDASVSEVGSQTASSGLIQLLARRARLQAERDGSGVLLFPSELTRSRSPEAAEVMARETRLFTLRRNERTGALALLGERIRQYQEQIQSLNAQIDSIDEQSLLIKPELEGLRTLYAKKLVPISRINQMERTAVQLDGSKAALLSNVAESRARISETREQMLNIDKSARSEAGNELAQTLTLLNDQQVRKASASDTFSRSVIRAPQSGVVDKIGYTTIGSAIPAAQPILQIVPDRDTLIVEGRVRPQDVDQLRLGQPARITFSGLERQTTPDIPGTLIFISPELAREERSGAAFYRIRVRIDAAAVARAKTIELKAGMPAEIFVQTGSRSVLSFLVKPLLDQIRYAFREG
jgi:HlyD family type I secretion membrane fusion protein